MGKIIITIIFLISLASCSNFEKPVNDLVLNDVEAKVERSKMMQSNNIVSKRPNSLVFARLENREDFVRAQKNAKRSLDGVPSGETTEWHNPDSKNRGTFTPIKNFLDANGKYCREYSQTIVINGKSKEYYGSACRQIDNSWKVVSSK